MKNALDNILVIALEQAVAAPFCSSRLADAGARVIKIERADGDFARHYDAVANGQSAYFVWLNRGKESIVLDIKNPADKNVLLSMILVADVFIQNLAPGASSRAGISSKDLRRQNPKLITVDISGYGPNGTLRNEKAYDLLIQCESGLASITGSIAEPGRVGVSVCDIATGMYAHAAVLEALVERNRTGQGKGIDVSLFDSMADWMTVPYLHQHYGHQSPPRLGLNHPSIAPYGAYKCKNNESIVFSIQNQREWSNFCNIVLADTDIEHHPKFATNFARQANRVELDARIGECLDYLTRDEALRLLRSANIACSRLNSVADLCSHDHLRTTHVKTPTGEVRIILPPGAISGETFGDVPSIGEHSEQLRQEFELR